ncbi:MAG: hypothetical protein RMJ33_05355 [Saprospiraceae bacterium]|nr:hypothetical protein [Saprospiraceae bacterium]MDW8229248.1 hypothetical protein [Saprospiraceae bacterium]
MTEQNFDRLLKEALENLEPPYDPTTWEALRQRLDAQTGDAPAAAEDAAWEANIRERLERLSAPYEAASWKALLARMRLQTQRKWYVYGAKTLEMALLLLLLLWLWDSDRVRPAASPSNATLQSPIAQSAESTKSMLQPPSAQLLNATGTPSSNSSSAVHTNPAEAQRPAQGNTEPQRPADALADASAAPLAENVVEPSRLPALSFLLTLPLQAPKRQSLASGEPTMATAPPVPAPASTVERRFYLFGAIVAQRHRILLPDAQQTAYGYGLSLRAEYRKRAWAWSTGLEYGDLAFAPQYRERIYQGGPQIGYYGVTLSQVRADMLLLPMAVSRRVLNAERWQGWITGGLTAHLALAKAYDYDYTYHPPGHLPPTQADPNAQPHLLERGRGLLEGGNLASNAYASADLGMRWEYSIPGGRYAWYVQPLYRRGLTPGVGINGERLHAWVLQVGLRVAP